eukprot:gene3537-3874_t
MVETEAKEALVDVRKDLLSGRRYAPLWLEVFSMGLCVILGGHSLNWNQGLRGEGGFWLYVIFTMIVGSGYICLASCLAEMASIFSFAGNMGNRLDPLLWLIIYAFIIPLQVYGGRALYKTCAAFAVTIFVLLLLYYFQAIPSRHLVSASGFEGGSSFLKHFAYCMWFFNGAEVSIMASSAIKEPTKRIPTVLVSTTCLACLLALCTLLTTAACTRVSHLSSLHHPFTAGYADSLNLSWSRADWLNMPALLGSAFVFSFAVSRQIRSMAGSGLLPKALRWSYEASGQHTPTAALGLGLAIGYIILLLVYLFLPSFQQELFHLCLFASCGTYIALFRAYMVFRGRYSNLERHFLSPLGLFGAWYGMAVFTALFLSTAFFLDVGHHTYWALITFVAILSVSFIYYLLVARKTEFYSKEEEMKLMKAYILNANRKKKKVGQRSRWETAFFSIMITFGGKSVTRSNAPAGSTMFGSPRKSIMQSSHHPHLSTVAPSSPRRSGALEASKEDNEDMARDGNGYASGLRSPKHRPLVTVYPDFSPASTPTPVASVPLLDTQQVDLNSKDTGIGEDGGEDGAGELHAVSRDCCPVSPRGVGPSISEDTYCVSHGHTMTMQPSGTLTLLHPSATGIVLQPPPAGSGKEESVRPSNQVSKTRGTS